MSYFGSTGTPVLGYLQSGFCIIFNVKVNVMYIHVRSLQICCFGKRFSTGHTCLCIRCHISL